MPVVVLLKKRWVLAVLAAGLGLALVLGIIALLRAPPEVAGPAAPPGTLATAPGAVRPFIEQPLFPPGSPGLQAAGFIARQNYHEAFQLLEKTDQQKLGSQEREGLELQRAVCERELGKYPEAVVRLRRLQGVSPALEDFRQLWLARALAGAGDRQGAIAAYEGFLPLCRHPALLEEARLELAELQIKDDHPQRAAELCAQVTGDQAPRALARLVQLCEARPDPEAARQHRLRLLEEHPGHPLALEMARQLPADAGPQEAYARGLVYFSHGRHQQAIQALERLLRAHPRHPLAREARYLLGRALLGDRQWEKARRLFAQLREKYQYPAALYQLGVVMGRLDRERQALRHYEQFARRYPQEELAPEALWQAARIAERDNRFALAGRLYRHLAEAYPASPYRDEARWYSGFMEYCRRDYAGALEVFVAVGRQVADPHLVDQGLFWAGKAAERLGRKEEAREYLQRAADHFPRSYYATRAAGMGYAPGPAAPSPALESAAPDTLALQRAAALLQLGLLDLALAELPASAILLPAQVEALKAIRDRCAALELRDRALRLSARIVYYDYRVEELRQAYPHYYFDQVREAAREAQVDPHLVLSVIRQESFFDARAVSPVGAMGLMQIMPQTGEVLARQLGLAQFDREQLLDPQLSIRMGSCYLGEQVRAFAGGPAPQLSLELGLAAYNAGPQAVRRWLGRLDPTDPDAFVERIPYRETRLYVKKVLRNWAIYKTLTQA